jgi:hypothetical protein
VAVRTRVNPVAIQSMFVPGGDIYKFAGKVENDVRTAARRRIRNRSRRLRRSVTARRRPNQYGVRFTVGAYAPYALYVELGTGPYISASRFGEHMTLYAGARFVPRRYARFKGAKTQFVSGQKPRLYLTNGLAAGLARNGLT